MNNRKLDIATLEFLGLDASLTKKYNIIPRTLYNEIAENRERLYEIITELRYEKSYDIREHLKKLIYEVVISNPNTEFTFNEAAKIVFHHFYDILFGIFPNFHISTNFIKKELEEAENIHFAENKEENIHFDENEEEQTEIRQECEICYIKKRDYMQCLTCKNEICEACYISLKENICPYCRAKYSAKEIYLNNSVEFLKTLQDEFFTIIENILYSNNCELIIIELIKLQRIYTIIEGIISLEKSNTNNE